MFNFPYGVCTIERETLLVSESDNHTVRLIHVDYDLIVECPTEEE